MLPENAKKWLAPAGIFLGLMLVLVLSNREPKSPEGLDLIDTTEKYQVALKKANDLTKPLFDKFDRGEDLTEQEKAQLFKAALLIDSANHLYPTKTIPFLGAGKAYMMSGDLATAESRLRQSIYNVQYDPSPFAKPTGIEAHHRLSQVRFSLGDYQGSYEEADLAVKAEPTGTQYLIARARALIQLKKYDAADNDLHAVARLEPGNTEIAGLHRLLELQDPKKFGRHERSGESKAPRK